MYQCPNCGLHHVPAIAVFSGKCLPVKCGSCGTVSYRKLSFIGELILSALLTFIGFTLILSKGAPVLLLMGLAGIVLVIAVVSHWLGRMIPYGKSPSRQGD